MSAALTIQLNGQPRTLADSGPSADLATVLQTLNLQADRIAVELNGSIIPRTDWPQTRIVSEDRLEVVHFVGGGKR